MPDFFEMIYMCVYFEMTNNGFCNHKETGGEGKNIYCFFQLKKLANDLVVSDYIVQPVLVY